MNVSLYIHIPFCKKKCSYCDFVSYSGKEEFIDKYINAVEKEITFIFKKNSLSIQTIYFGGGTPILLEPKHFEIILKNVKIPNEVTIEANPGTADQAKLYHLRQLGINRLSIGAQTFNDHHLKMLGRIHSGKDIVKFYYDARSAGFENINLDLIFALPNQTFSEWKKDLSVAICLSPNHLSTYNLQIEEKTPLKEALSQGLKLSTEEEELAMYEYTIETLPTHGYRHYEISSFAQPFFECQHNLNYWKNGNYLGIGAGAHSHFCGKRWANPSSIEEYIKLWESTENRQSFLEKISLTTGQPKQRETIFMGLRLRDGLETHHFDGFEKEVEELINSDLLEKHDGKYRLTRSGLYLANLVLEKFL